jgi:signal transduction histidine kinase
MMSLEILKMKFTDPASQEMLAILQTSAQRGADLVGQVLSFARGVEGQRIEVHIQHLVHEIEKIANETFPKHIRVLTVVPRDLWTVVGDPTQLHQVLLNLCVNARDAMPEGGTLTITAENLILDAHHASMSIHPEAPVWASPPRSESFRVTAASFASIAIWEKARRSKSISPRRPRRPQKVRRKLPPNCPTATMN